MQVLRSPDVVKFLSEVFKSLLVWVSFFFSGNHGTRDHVLIISSVVCWLLTSQLVKVCYRHLLDKPFVLFFSTRSINKLRHATKCNRYLFVKARLCENKTCMLTIKNKIMQNRWHLPMKAILTSLNICQEEIWRKKTLCAPTSLSKPVWPAR